jgi:hypothetical protein
MGDQPFVRPLRYKREVVRARTSTLCVYAYDVALSVAAGRLSHMVIRRKLILIRTQDLWALTRVLMDLRVTQKTGNF